MTTVNDSYELFPPRAPINSAPPAGQFLTALFKHVTDDCWLELYFLLPDDLPSIKGKPRKFTAYVPMPFNRDVPDIPAIITDNNALGYGVYFGTTPSRDKKEPQWKVNDEGREYKTYPRRHESDVPNVPALWVDVDDCTVDAFWARHYEINAPEPALVVSSGGGIHAYWRLDEPFTIDGDIAKARVKRLLKAIALAYNGDTHATDLARIMRMPSTVNTKPKRNGARCEVVSQWVSSWKFGIIEREFHGFLPVSLPRPTRNLPTINSDELPPVTVAYLNNPPFEGARNAKLYSASRGCNDIGMTQSEAERVLMSTALSTGLDEKEALITIASAYRAPRGLSNSNASVRMAMNDKRKK